MSGSVLGRHKSAATRLGISLKTYERHIARGESWCWTCKSWRDVRFFYRRVGYLSDPANQCADCHRTYMRAYMRKRAALKRTQP